MEILDIIRHFDGEPYIRNVHDIIDVYDGDTVTLIVDSGYEGLDKIKVRFKGINTAEMRGSKKGSERFKLATEAKDFVKFTLENHRVCIYSDKFEVGGFGRYLGTLFYKKNDEWFSLNEKLLELGLAQIYYPGASKDFGDWK